MDHMSESETSAQEPARDVLAAEAFAVPGPDPSLHQGPVVLPDDPSGIDEPHDVLAAEEFAMPAARSSRVAGMLSGGSGSSTRLAVAVVGGTLLGLLALRLLRRR
jgi:hypothetical protein